MARIDRVRENYEQITEKLFSDKEMFADYLKFAGKFYKLPSSQSMTIYGANPNAVMVADYDTWQKFGRQVQRGTTSIAVFNNAGGLKHLFDISRTTGAKTPYQWKLDKNTATELLDEINEDEGQRFQSLSGCINYLGAEKAREDISGVIKSLNISDDDRTAFERSFISMTQYFIAARCELGSGFKYNGNVDLSALDMLHSKAEKEKLCECVQLSGKSVLLSLERSINNIVLQGRTNDYGRNQTDMVRGGQEVLPRVQGTERQNVQTRSDNVRVSGANGVGSDGRGTGSDERGDRNVRREVAEVYDGELSGSDTLSARSAEMGTDTQTDRQRGLGVSGTASETVREREPAPENVLGDSTVGEHSGNDSRQGDNGGHSAAVSRVSGEDEKSAIYGTNSQDSKAEEHSPAFSLSDDQKYVAAKAAEFLGYDVDRAVFNKVYSGVYAYAYDTKTPINNIPDDELNDVISEIASAITKPEIPDDLDKIYVDRENETVRMVYYNPDSTAGGQLVYNEFDFDDIAAALRQNDPLDYIISSCKQTAVDVDMPGFDEAARDFLADTEDFNSRDEHYLDKLFALAEPTYSIFQLKGGDDTRDYRFAGLSELRERGLHVDRENYDKVYSGRLKANETLDDIYDKFNIDRPEDFTGHSLSVGDIIEIRRGGKVTANYVDDYGFEEIPDFYLAMEERKTNRTADKTAVEEFKAKTAENFVPINGLTPSDIEGDVRGYIQSVLDDNEIDAHIVDLAVVGSRSRNLNDDNSDLDVAVEFTSELKEDALFNILHEQSFDIGGVTVDINPIRAEETGTLGEYLKNAEKTILENHERKLAEKNSAVIKPTFDEIISAVRLGKFARITEKTREEPMITDARKAKFENITLQFDNSERGFYLTADTDKVKNAVITVFGRNDQAVKDYLAENAEQTELSSTRYIGTVGGIGYYYMEKPLSLKTAPEVKHKCEKYIIAAPALYLDDDFLKSSNITFIKLGRDISKNAFTKKLDEIVAAMTQAEISIAKGEDSIQFGLFGNGVTVYDIAKWDDETNDYPIVAHISNEGEIKYYSDELGKEDVARIVKHATSVKQSFTESWNKMPTDAKYQRILDAANALTGQKWDSFFADKTALTMDEAVEKYEHSLIYGDEEFPEAKRTVTAYKVGDFYEVFNEDAQTAADYLNLAQTKRSGVPMAGFPAHVLDDYKRKFAMNGYHLKIGDERNIEKILAEGRTKAESKKSVDELKVGDLVRGDRKIWRITKIDGDFSITFENTDKSDNMSVHSIWGHWKEQFFKSGYEYVFPSELSVEQLREIEQSAAKKKTVPQSEKAAEEPSNGYEGEQLNLFGEPAHEVDIPERNYIGGVDIEQALTRDIISHGTMFRDGKFRIEEYYHSHKGDTKGFAKAIANEYGTGGHSGDGKIRLVSYDSKGVEMRIWLNEGEDTKVHWSWKKVADRIATLIDNGEYITERDIDERIKNAEYDYKHNEAGSDEYERAAKILDNYGLLPDTAPEQSVTVRAEELEKGDKIRLDGEEWTVRSVGDTFISLTNSEGVEQNFYNGLTEKWYDVLNSGSLELISAHDEPLIENEKTAELESENNFSSTLMSDESEIPETTKQTIEDNFPVTMWITTKSEESRRAVADMALRTGATVEKSDSEIHHGKYQIRVDTWESRADEIKDFALEQGAEHISEHGVFQVVKDYGSLTYGFAHRSLDAAIQDARDQIKDGVVGAAVYNIETKEIKFTVGEFDVEHSFTEDVLKANGYPIEEKQTDLERAKELISDFCDSEYESTADFSDLTRVDLAYTEDEETQLPINVFADLENKRIVSQFNNVTVRVDEYKSLKEMNDLALSELNFDELIFDTITANDKLTETIEKSAAETPEQAHPAETEKPVEVKNLAQLKRIMTVGTEFEITSGIHPDIVNQLRQVKYADTTGIYSIRPDAPDDKISTANGGRGYYMQWGKAADWEFSNGKCTAYRKGAEHTPENVFFSFIIKPRVLEKQQTEIPAQDKKPTQGEIKAVDLAQSMGINVVDMSGADKVLSTEPDKIELDIEQETKASFSELPDNPITKRLSDFFPLDTAKRLYNAFENSKMPDWNGNSAKINRIKKAMYDILGNEEQTERAFSIISSAVQNAKDFTITDEHLGEGGAKAKFAANIAAIQTLKNIERENRFATPAEQETLSKYVGWGGLPQAFDRTNGQWAKEYEQLSKLLTDDEYRDASASVLNAHYTTPTVIRAIYKGIQNLGFESGNILEPAMGIGNFFGAMPEDMRKDSNLSGVELDSISGRIAKQLYPNADIQVKGFEKTNFSDNYFDVVVGNVPFGSIPVSDKRYNRENFYIHDYFIAKSLDKVAPGGIVAVVTTKGTLDKEKSKAREYFAKRADLIGAIRLPNNAFKANAGTEVTTDILFLQKCEEMAVELPDWCYVGKTADGVPVNNYFVDHPEMILGTMKQGMEFSMYGNDKETACVPIEGAVLSEQLEQAVANLKISNAFRVHKEQVERQAGVIPARPDVRNFTFAEVDGKMYFRENNVMTEVTEKDGTVTKGKKLERLKALNDLRKTFRDLLTAQENDCSDEQLREYQNALNTKYDNFVKKFDYISAPVNYTAFAKDDDYNSLTALEVVNEETKEVTKSDIFSRRTIKHYAEITHVETPQEAIYVAIDTLGRPDIEYMAKLCDKEPQEVIDALKADNLIYFDPNKANAENELEGWVETSEYLSGNVRVKLKAAELAAKDNPEFQRNVEALTAVIPKRIEAGDISARIGVNWVDLDDYKKFFENYTGTRFQQEFRRTISGEYKITNKGWFNTAATNQIYGTKRLNAFEIFENLLNCRDVIVRDKKTDPTTGKDIYVINKKETELAQDKANKMKDAFARWIWADPERREKYVTRYNELFNSIVGRKYDGSHQTFPGMSPFIKLKPHQLDAIARAKFGGNTLLAHCVGAGKSFEMIAAVMEKKRLGLINKACVVVPKSLVGQMAAEWLRLYPQAKILTATEKDFTKDRRQKFIGRCCTGEYDAVIMSYEQFEKTNMSFEYRRDFIKREIDTLAEGIAQLKTDYRTEQENRGSIKDIQRVKKNLEAKLEKLINDNGKEKDTSLSFEQLGFDSIVVDEAHNYKNGLVVTKMNRVAGVQTTPAQKSEDILMKTQYLNENYGERNIIFATGTPVAGLQQLNTKFNFNSVFVGNSHDLDHRRGNLALFFKR